MAYITVEDFYNDAVSCRRLTRDEEKEYAGMMKNGDDNARRQLIRSYMPMVMSYVIKANHINGRLGLAMHCMDTLEKAVDHFDFLQDSESFSHHLSWHLRNAVAKYRVEQHMEKRQVSE